jgi:hypothetical protein
MEGDKKKIVCCTRYGSYEFLMIPFEFTNALVTFCTFMNDIFWEWLNDFVVICIDDILVYSNSMEEHAEHFQKVFQRLEKNKLYVKFKKYEFKAMEMDFLEHRITQEGLKTDDHKVKENLDWESPRSIPALRSFLRLASYYYKFIKNFAKIAMRLTNLLKKSSKTNEWNKVCNETFDTLKGILVKTLMLKLIDFDKDFEIHFDASDFAIGGILVRDGRPVEGQWKAIYIQKQNVE